MVNKNAPTVNILITSTMGQLAAAKLSGALRGATGKLNRGRSRPRIPMKSLHKAKAGEAATSKDATQYWQGLDDQSVWKRIPNNQVRNTTSRKTMQGQELALGACQSGRILRRKLIAAQPFFLAGAPVNNWSDDATLSPALAQAAAVESTVLSNLTQGGSGRTQPRATTTSPNYSLTVSHECRVSDLMPVMLRSCR
jgi:hypothetical protein